ncbi:MAG: LPD11 domain-containing protein [Parvimonas sp.]|uniref:LPD11 domain-containing protein n=1 Tax=Parvimonas sp. TaxID=1944660 RepID=UPI002A75718C|nr:LPD11 domain-containing protein [Parvimonas sp.]MDY3050709.1 LPD11 domain-containing protein [Parvimonas sp.]
MVENKKDYWIVEFNETGKDIKGFSNKIVTKDLINELEILNFNLLQSQGYYKFYFDHIEDGKRTEHIRIDLGSKDENTKKFLNYLREEINKDLSLKDDNYDFSNEPEELKYRILGRLESDCKYFLGFGFRDENKLYTKNVDKQIDLMKNLYNSLEEKPEWITLEQIEDFESKMKDDLYEDMETKKFKEDEKVIEIDFEKEVGEIEEEMEM